MKFLKGLALGLVGFLLFLCLPVLGLAFTINSTAMNSQFVTKEAEKIDMTSYEKDLLNGMIPSEYQAYSSSAIDATIIEMQPWINQQIETVVNGSYDYLQDRKDTINLTLSAEPIRQSLAINLENSIIQSPAYTQMSPAQKLEYPFKAKQQLLDYMPENSTVQINPDTIGADNMDTLQQVKTIFGYIHNSYIWLLIAVIIFILLIIFILRDIKAVTRSLGTNFVIIGGLGYIGFLLAKHYVPGLFASLDVPDQIRNWIPIFVNDLLSPEGIFSLVILIIGAILLVSSFFVHSREAKN